MPLNTLKHNTLPTINRSDSPTRAGLYIRVSTAAQAERWSLPAQERILLAHARKNEWAPQLYNEGAASAETIEERPVLQQLLSDVAGGLIDVVLVIEMERLCRASDLRDWAMISSTCRKANVRIASPERVYDLSTAEDDFEADLRGILSKREKRKLLERTKRGLDEARDAGRFIGGHPPLGYKYDVATKKVVIDEDEVPLAKHIFESQLSSWQLAKELRSQGVQIDFERVKRTRRLEFYLGKRRNSEGDLIQADWPQLIDNETWDLQQRRIKTKRRAPRRDGPSYLLSGLVRCGYCDGPLVGNPLGISKETGKRSFVYKCRNYGKCNGGQVTGWLTDLIINRAIQEYVGNKEQLRRRFVEAAEIASDPELKGQRLTARKRLSQLENSESNLLDAVEKGLLSDDIVRKRSKAIQAERKLIETQLTNSEETIPSIPEFNELLKLVGQLPTEDFAVQRRLVEKLTKRVSIRPRDRRVTLHWEFGGETVLDVPKFRGGPGSRVRQTCSKLGSGRAD